MSLAIGDSVEFTEETKRVCGICEHASPQVYMAGWMCLQPKCAAFWQFPAGTAVPEVLEYSPAFLCPVPLSTDQILADLRPSLPVSGVPHDRITTSKVFRKGFHCIDCGRLSSRYFFQSHGTDPIVICCLKVQMGTLGMSQLQGELLPRIP
jgi:hypothetical protein